MNKNKVKCADCGRWIDKETVSIINSKKYCEICAQPHKTNAEAYKSLSTFIYDNLVNRNQFLLKLCLYQAKAIKEKYGLKYQSIEYTLRYMYEYMDTPLEFDPEHGISNILFYVEEAKHYFEQVWENKRTPEQHILSIITKPQCVVTIERSDLIKIDNEFAEKEKLKKGLQLLDMEDIDIAEDSTIVEEERAWLKT